MSLSWVKEKLFNYTDMFFKGAAIVWAEQSGTKPKPPYITLKTRGTGKTFFPVDGSGGDRYYSCSTTWEVNLYTQGRAAVADSQAASSYENTAEDDLLMFVMFLESPAMLDTITKDNLDIQLMPPVRDLTELLNDIKYRYRAMAEFTVSFTEKTSGRYGISDMESVPNASGGGTEKQRKAKNYVIKKIEIKEETGNEQ